MVGDREELECFMRMRKAEVVWKLRVISLSDV